MLIDPTKPWPVAIPEGGMRAIVTTMRGTKLFGTVYLKFFSRITAELAGLQIDVTRPVALQLEPRLFKPFSCFIPLSNVEVIEPLSDGEYSNMINEWEKRK
jgi:hypothetical protein